MLDKGKPMINYENMNKLLHFFDVNFFQTTIIQMQLVKN
jgi:hypothetical protein